MSAVIRVPVCTLRSGPTRSNTCVDEVLLGWPVEVLDTPRPGWVQLRTHYRYEGYARWEDLCLEPPACRQMEFPLRMVGQAIADVLEGPDIKCPVVTTLLRGSLVSAVGMANDAGWQKTLLPDGREGWLRATALKELPHCPTEIPEEELRRRIVAAAQAYLGVPYRWGGRTPLGLDCSGLTAMAYLLNGILIYRDAALQEGFPIHPIAPEELRPADLLYFPGHVALYLGEGRYIHATARDGRVTVNSLCPDHGDYRPDLAQNMVAAGSWFDSERFKKK